MPGIKKRNCFLEKLCSIQKDVLEASRESLMDEALGKWGFSSFREHPALKRIL